MSQHHSTQRRKHFCGIWELALQACHARTSFSGEARGPGSLGGPGSWYSHGQTAHSSRKPRAGTPSRAGTPCPLPFLKGCRRGGGVPAGRGVPARRGVGVPARRILRPIAAWEYHEPGPPNEPGPLAFSQKKKHPKARNRAPPKRYLSNSHEKKWHRRP